MSERIHFGKLTEAIEPPNLIELQVNSYNEFFQKDVPASKRRDIGLQAVFREFFPIFGFEDKSSLDFVSYELGESKMSALECQREGQSFSAPLYVTFRYKDERSTKEEKVYMGELPLMTPQGTFVINGAERVVVSQLHRSPGICFETSVHANGKILHGFRIIPDRGSWIEVQFDTTDLLYVYLDRRKRRRKFLATTFLRTVGFPADEQIINLFYKTQDLKLSEKLDEEEIATKVLIADIRDGEITVGRAFEPLTTAIVRQLIGLGHKSVKVVDTKDDDTIIKSLKKDPAHDEDEALKDIYRKLRPGDPPTVQNARSMLKRLFFDAKRYDLGRVGRHKINQKLDLKVDENERTLTKDDFVAAMKYLVRLRAGDGMTDDIDHLGSRRVRTVGELLANQCRVGLARTERLVRERMTLFDANTDQITPQKLINPKSLSAVVRDFFGRSQLSQFMDQTNPLSELTHKRRLSALGPGGLSRDRAGFEVRDVHPSHYGRICPIETPEGPNIGLISSLSTFARINEFGFIETPYRKVVNGRVTDQVEYLSGDRDENFYIAQANSEVDAKGNLSGEKVSARYRGDFLEIEPAQIQYMDVSPKQLVSVAAGLIPFLEHDDANRALMGSNMQRQAVPLLVTEPPIVATGMERDVATNSGLLVRAAKKGTVTYVDAELIEITPSSGAPDSYPLRKYVGLNERTCQNQKPIVTLGQKVEKGEVIADGAATYKGELALGRNVLVGFMAWDGFNFEDAIIISEELVENDVYTSIHIEEYDIEIRDTKLGREEFTRDIPNVGERALKSLDEGGIVKIGTYVRPGDILVGKVSPKSKTELTPEEKLLHAIFGRAGEDVKNDSLEVPSGVEGIVIATEKFSRQMSLSEEERREFQKQVKEAENQGNLRIAEAFGAMVAEMEKVLQKPLTAADGSPLVRNQDHKVVAERAASFTLEGLDIRSPQRKTEIDKLHKTMWPAVEEAIDAKDRTLNSMKRGDELRPGVLQMVKVYVAAKRVISVGDKMAGRHGNKGVIAKILPKEDMPFLADGTPVQILLNPLGVPSRMNVGQILETHLGWAGKLLGFQAITPVFDGASEEDINAVLADAGRPRHGTAQLHDGRTGEPLEQETTVGYIYMLKLHHLVDDKVHARSTGPYSLITQQPLGGKARFGGQRFGEMEVWALEAYGAAYILQELLTVKSDDVEGRTKIYESMVKGENTLEAGTPASFDVLTNEIRGLALNMQLEKRRI
ncbi:MAG: DNA-directed RNA polymerase subunit beta [Planctomycetia bacterium]